MKISDELRAWITEYNPEALLADGLEEAIIGVGCQACGLPIVIYDKTKCVEIMARGFLHDPERNVEDDAYMDAMEWCEYNVWGGYVGENGPIFMEPIPEYLEQNDLHTNYE